MSNITQTVEGTSLGVGSSVSFLPTMHDNISEAIHPSQEHTEPHWLDPKNSTPAYIWTNSSVPDMCRDIPTGIQHVQMPILMGLCGVFGNLLALYVLYNTRTEMRRSFFYTLVAGLAITDLIGQLCTAPLAVVAYASKLTFLSNMTGICKLHGFLMVCFGLVTPLIVCLMALERVGALCCTYFCSRFLTKQRIRSALAACWIFAIAFASLPFIGFGEFALQFPCSWCFLKFHMESDNPNDYETIVNSVYSSTYAVINLVVIAVTLVSNVLVAIVLLQARKRRRVLTNGVSFQSSDRVKDTGHAHVQRRGSAQRDHNLELQMVWLLCGMTLVFTFCWTPFMSRILAVVISGATPHPAGDLMAVRAAALNQILDPWVYILLRRSLFFRIRSMVLRLFGCPEGTGCGGKSTTTGRASLGLGHRRWQVAEEKLVGMEERSPGLVLNVLHAEEAMEQVQPCVRTRDHRRSSFNQIRQFRTRTAASSEMTEDSNERQGLMFESRPGQGAAYGYNNVQAEDQSQAEPSAIPGINNSISDGLAKETPICVAEELMKCMDKGKDCGAFCDDNGNEKFEIKVHSPLLNGLVDQSNSQRSNENPCCDIHLVESPRKPNGSSIEKTSPNNSIVDISPLSEANYDSRVNEVSDYVFLNNERNINHDSKSDLCSKKKKT